MTFVSYAQNLEDVFLFRAFKERDCGFYVDVGANDPVKDSVTQAFYERGWYGVNIDPVPHWHERLQKNRKRDVNLDIALSDQNGTFDFFEIPETGLSTLDPLQAESYRQQGKNVRAVTVQTRTLAEVLDQYAPPEIHFLKIDVEGAEEAVIRGGDWQKHRPWIVLIESTLPNTNISVHESWEPILLNNGYHFAWFDGINRFYVADEHSELDEAFRVPINVLDNYVSIDALELRVGVREQKIELVNISLMREQLIAREKEVEELNEGLADAAKAHQNLAVLYEAAVVSLNRWPFRIARKIIRAPRALVSRLKRLMILIVRKPVLMIHQRLSRNPQLMSRVFHYLKRKPTLNHWARRIAGKPQKIMHPTTGSAAGPLLAPGALKIYKKITEV